MNIEQQLEELRAAHKTVQAAYPEISGVTWDIKNLPYDDFENWRVVYQPAKEPSAISNRLYLFLIEGDGFYACLSTVPVKVKTIIQVENL